MNIESPCRPPRSCSSGVILGIGVILLGTVLLLNQIPGIRESRILDFVKDLWPLILVAMGIAHTRGGRRPSRGWVLITVGLILLVMTLGHGRFDALVWPAVLLCAGILIVLRALRRQQRPFREFPEFSDSEDFLRGTAVMSGFRQKVLSHAFKGGELTAIFGGFELDLRQAVMAGDSARLDVFLLFGGGEIRVPENWEVVMQATAIAGGVGEKHAPLAESSERHPRLIITGLILFGGAEFKR